MKYVCLVHFAPEVLASLSPAEQEALTERSMAYNEELAAGGQLIIAQALDLPDSAVLVKVRSGEISTTDGPFTETKEQLAGFVMIEARDLNDAIRAAAGIPLARMGTIEVRPIFVPPPASGAAR